MVGGPQAYGLQLAYCNNDVRRLGYFVDELVAYDDLFFLCFYSEDLAFDPQSSGKLCTAHIITLHGDTISAILPSRLRWVEVQGRGVQQTGEADQENLQGRPALSSEVHLMSMAANRRAPKGFGGCVAYGPPFGIGLPVDPPEGRPLVIEDPAAAAHHHASFGLVSDAGHPFIHGGGLRRVHA